MSVRTCVIYNPAAGRGKAESLLQTLRPSLGSGGELWPTARSGHAADLAVRAVEDGFERVVAAGGDGTVHEVANGILTAGRKEVIFSTWPLGSANDYSCTLGMTEWWRRRAENLPTETIFADVGVVRGAGRERFYVNSLGVGFNGLVTIEARRIRWLRGIPLYTLAFLKALVKHYATPPMTVTFDEEVRDGPTLALTVNLAQREGGFPLTPGASLTDGLFDYLHATALSRWNLIRYLPAMATGRLPERHANIRHGRCRHIGVQAKHPLCVHTDGEFFCLPGDGTKEVTIDMRPAALRVEVFPQALYGGRLPLQTA